jgi:ribonuclease BN (tRNA processing enzyme)
MAMEGSTVKITLLPSCLGTDAERSLQYLTSFLINDVLAIDAGCLGFFRTAREQAEIKHVFLSHSHMDHIASLPIFLENVYGQPSAVTVHASQWVLNCLQSDLFNDRIWPDFARLARKGEVLLNTAVLAPLAPVHLDGLIITPVPVDHPVPAFGFLVEDATGSVAISGDTGPTEEIWRRANALPNLKAVFLEVAFPNAMAHLAAEAKHHTPRSFGQEMLKLRLPIPVFAYHIKASFREQVVKELHELGLPNLRIAEAGKPYLF